MNRLSFRVSLRGIHTPLTAQTELLALHRDRLESGENGGKKFFDVLLLFYASAEAFVASQMFVVPTIGDGNGFFVDVKT